MGIVGGIENFMCLQFLRERRLVYGAVGSFVFQGKLFGRLRKSVLKK